jgi:hypothetical protein
MRVRSPSSGCWLGRWARSSPRSPFGARLKELRAKSIDMALNEDAAAIAESDRVWLIAAISRVLGKAGVTGPAAERLR